MDMQDIKLMKEKNGPASRAISKAMRIRRYNAERIAQYDRSKATLNATGRHHRAIICPVSPRRTPSVDPLVSGDGQTVSYQPHIHANTIRSSREQHRCSHNL